MITLSAEEFAARPDLLGVGINISSPDELTMDQLEKILAGVAMQLVKNRINREDDEGADDQLALI